MNNPYKGATLKELEAVRKTLDQKKDSLFMKMNLAYKTVREAEMNHRRARSEETRNMLNEANRTYHRIKKENTILSDQQLMVMLASVNS